MLFPAREIDGRPRRIYFFSLSSDPRCSRWRRRASCVRVVACGGPPADLLRIDNEDGTFVDPPSLGGLVRPCSQTRASPQVIQFLHDTEWTTRHARCPSTAHPGATTILPSHLQYERVPTEAGAVDVKDPRTRGAGRLSPRNRARPAECARCTPRQGSLPITPAARAPAMRCIVLIDGHGASVRARSWATPHLAAAVSPAKHPPCVCAARLSTARVLLQFAATASTGSERWRRADVGQLDIPPSGIGPAMPSRVRAPRLLAANWLSSPRALPLASLIAAGSGCIRRLKLSQKAAPARRRAVHVSRAVGRTRNTRTLLRRRSVRVPALRVTRRGRHRARKYGRAALVTHARTHGRSHTERAIRRPHRPAHRGRPHTRSCAAFPFLSPALHWRVSPAVARAVEVRAFQRSAPPAVRRCNGAGGTCVPTLWEQRPRYSAQTRYQNMGVRTRSATIPTPPQRCSPAPACILHRTQCPVPTGTHRGESARAVHRCRAQYSR
ncbi:hypothetical protein BC628DRAFT_568727 [Trametes gibbosa]|nr:hypothetical protein BC628DRAFT_568727 [Trametes gibbosa]